MTATPRYYPAEDVPVSKKSVAVKRNVSCTFRRMKKWFHVGCGALVINAWVVVDCIRGSWPWHESCWTLDRIE